MKRFERKAGLCGIPIAAGLLLFYILPFLKMAAQSFLKSQYRRKFVWFDNYKSVITNEYFRLACKNTLFLILICVPVFVTASFLLAWLCRKCGGFGTIIRSVVPLPFILPSVSVTAAFLTFFKGMNNPIPIYLIFLWKYVGIGVIIMASALMTVPEEIYDAAKVDGAGEGKILFFITLPVLRSTLLFLTVLGVVYCFRTFRESYLFYGSNYPPDYSYTLQYYLNNHFLKLDYPVMAAASVLITLLLTAVIVAGTKKEKGNL